MGGSPYKRLRYGRDASLLSLTSRRINSCKRESPASEVGAEHRCSKPLRRHPAPAPWTHAHSVCSHHPRLRHAAISNAAASSLPATAAARCDDDPRVSARFSRASALRVGVPFPGRRRRRRRRRRWRAAARSRAVDGRPRQAPQDRRRRRDGRGRQGDHRRAAQPRVQRRGAQAVRVGALGGEADGDALRLDQHRGVLARVGAHDGRRLPRGVGRLCPRVGEQDLRERRAARDRQLVGVPLRRRRRARRPRDQRRRGAEVEEEAGGEPELHDGDRADGAEAAARHLRHQEVHHVDVPGGVRRRRARDERARGGRRAMATGGTARTTCSPPAALQRHPAH